MSNWGMRNPYEFPEPWEAGGEPMDEEEEPVTLPANQDVIREQEEDALMMAVSREWELPRTAEATGIDERWLSAFVAVRMADVLAQLSTGQRLKQLTPSERAFIREQVEQTIEDVCAKFKPHHGDPEYQPQDEPEYDFEGRTEEEATK